MRDGSCDASLIETSIASSIDSGFGASLSFSLSSSSVYDLDVSSERDSVDVLDVES